MRRAHQNLLSPVVEEGIDMEDLSRSEDSQSDSVESWSRQLVHLTGDHASPVINSLFGCKVVNGLTTGRVRDVPASILNY